MDILSLCPLQVGALHWMPREGSHAMTVVCKATFDLTPGTASLAEVQDFPNDEDNHWDDDTNLSVYAPSDMAPFKRRADVVLVGEAFAPGGNPVTSLVARMMVGAVDKAIEVHQNRFFDQNGELKAAKPFVRMPLRYERAGGGPHGSNPVGLSPESERDQYGRLSVPNLRPVGATVSSASDHVEPVGFGPIAATWDARRRLLGRHSATWSNRRWMSQPLPQDIDGGYFSCAPTDQRLDAISDRERLVLEHLHPDHPQLVCHLPGIRPRAFMERGGSAQPLALRPDTLWIDTTRSVCTLTWRGHVEVDDSRERGLVIVGMEEGQRRLTWSDIRKLKSGDTVPDDHTEDEVPVVPKKELPFESSHSVDDEHTAAAPELPRRESLPAFLTDEPDKKEAPRPRPASVMPAISHAPRSGRTDHIPIVTNEDLSPAWLGSQAQAQQAVEARKKSASSHDFAEEAFAPAPSPWAKGGSDAPTGPTNAAAGTPSAPPPPIPQPPTPSAPPPAIRLPNPVEDMRRSAASTLDASPTAIPIDRIARPKSAEIVELIWFHEEIMAQVDEQQAFEELLADLRKDEGEDEPIDFDEAPPPAEPPEVKQRREIVAIMTQGRVTASASLHPVMLDSVDASGSFEPPIVLMSGRLHLPFDELETLKATLAAVTPMTAGNKELADTVATVEELMKTPWLQEGSGEVAQNLTDKIRAVFKKGDRMLDPAYLDDHTERILLEQRRYQKRTVLGDEWLRALLAPSASKERIPTYIPMDLAKDLPMFKVFPARVIAEAHVQQDQYEQHQCCLKVRAFGRVVQLTKTPAIY